jgi:hypothetical protein
VSFASAPLQNLQGQPLHKLVAVMVWNRDSIREKYFVWVKISLTHEINEICEIL